MRMGDDIIAKRIDRLLTSKYLNNNHFRIDQWVGLGGE
jgi:hypothetical protein